MASIRQILVDWTTVNGGGKLSVFYASTAATVEDQREALGTFLNSVRVAQTTDTSYSIRAAGIEVDETDGTLTGDWHSGTPATGTGTNTGEPVPDAAQVLVRWKSSDIVNGRFVQGRTFLPGFSSQAVTDGNLNGPTQSAVQAAALILIESEAAFGIWSRPLFDPESHALVRAGSFHVASTESVWNELAVLRKRRG